MTLPGIVVLLDVLAAVAFLAGLIGRTITLRAAARADDLGAVRTLVAASQPFERMVTVGSLVVLVVGVAAALAVGRPLLGPLQGARVDWLFVSLVLYLTMVPLVPLIFLPGGRAFEAALADATATGRVTERLRAAFADPAVRAARTYEAGAVTVILALMVTKPF